MGQIPQGKNISFFTWCILIFIPGFIGVSEYMKNAYKILTIRSFYILNFPGFKIFHPVWRIKI